MAAEDDESMTLQEYITKEEQLEAEARDVLPGKFDECTYKMGYINQSVYVCRSCVVDNRPAAVCYSCSIECHTSCDLVELMGKRDFRGDCGNSRYATCCKLEPSKDNENTHNVYEPLHNFSGRFCSCDQLCNAEVEETMYQCLSCQDWFHESCIDGLPDPDSFADFICAKCPKTILRQVLNCGKTGVDLSGDDQAWFLQENWRDSVCRCDRCTALLNDYKYIAEEPVFWEPEPDDGKITATNVVNTLLQDRNLLDKGSMAMNKLKDKLSLFLKNYPKDTVSREDIELFFASL